jgi:hypothetical protein
MQGQGSAINSRRLLASGKQIAIRSHTGFIHVLFYRLFANTYGKSLKHYRDER